MIDLNNINVTREGSRVINNVSLSILPGQIISLIGPNGAGKSSLLQVIGGLISVESGGVSVVFGNAQANDNTSTPTFDKVLPNSEDLLSLPASIRARHLASLPQQNSLGFAYSVREVVSLGRFPHATGIVEDELITSTVMKLLDVMRLADRNYLSLSGGEQQRVHLARVICQIWPRNNAQGAGNILLLDEPDSSLDLGHKQKLFRVLQDLAKKGVTVVIAEHDVNMALRFSHAVGVLKRGELVAFGTPKDIIVPELMAKVFDAEVCSYLNADGLHQMGF